MIETIQSTNRAINIDINVSINVGALKANIQRGLQATWVAIKQLCNVGTWSLAPIFRVIDAHPKISNLWIGGWAIACFYLIFMYA